MDIETQNLIDSLTEACTVLDRARDRLAMQTGDADAVDVSTARLTAVAVFAARLISVAEDVMLYAEERSREASEQIAYWADPVAAQERMADD